MPYTLSETASITPHPLAIRNPRRMALVLLGLMLLAVFIGSLAFGSVAIPLEQVVAILTGREPAQASWGYIVLTLRLPRACTAVLAGAALAVSGLQMQTLFRNPLAEPFILGISAGASLGVALLTLATGTVGMLAGIGLVGHLGLTSAAIAGAAGVMSLVLVLGRRIRSNTTLLILGLMFGYVAAAIVSVLIHFGAPEHVQLYLNWTFGNFGAVGWPQLGMLATVISGGLLGSFLLAKPLNALLLGEVYARSLGLNVALTRFWIIVSASLLAGTTTAYCGPIAFLGIAVPHLCRSLFRTTEHRLLVPATLLLGGLLALLADCVARLPGSDLSLPLNAVTALIGAPTVMWILLRHGSQRELADR
ncbi:MAG: iron ABC transporter permease [Gammaproteobacteria bacterium]|nr:iron ABC transporter permease [Gammaproteobacteria bacterium]MCP5425771.1 iron ABC transporter permease [Gammaproteobacteria bacterium]MCP5458618.1 iron ABC transporter permease [Gammaproteobacteria bacterium]